MPPNKGLLPTPLRGAAEAHGVQRPCRARVEAGIALDIVLGIVLGIVLDIDIAFVLTLAGAGARR